MTSVDYTDVEELALDMDPATLMQLDSALVIKYITKLQTLLKEQQQEIEQLKCQLKQESNVPAEKVEQEEQHKSPAQENVENNEATAKTESTDAEFVNDAFSLVDEMRQAANLAKNFIYEPTSGLYYDQKTGYYYNAEYGLYYDGNTGCYYSYNEKKEAYEFHSQVQVQPNQKTQNDDPLTDTEQEIEFDEWGGVITDKELLRQIKQEKSRVLEKEKNKRKKNKHDKKSHKHKHRKQHHNDDKNEFEDGELSTSESSDSEADACDVDDKDKTKLDDSQENVTMFEKSNKFQAIAKKYPPSLRLIVKETNLEKLKVGSLSLITYKGGTLGREGEHDVIIPDANVSKYHLKFCYNDKKSIYQCTDMGSRNGTLLNGKSITNSSKKRAESQNIPHGSIIQISATKLLCHIHEGNTTCGQCEPGLLIQATTAPNNTANVQTALSHKEGLKKLQKRYGLENEKFVESSGGIKNFNDRAASRRLHVGSSTDKEKTQVASVNTEISSENKGFKMLSKLGWNKGETLGKDGGLLEPINVVQYEAKQGFGSEVAASGSSEKNLSKSAKQKLQNLHKTRERFAKTTDMFVVEDDTFNMKQ